jgi:hypothetical protein
MCKRARVTVVTDDERFALLELCYDTLGAISVEGGLVWAPADIPFFASEQSRRAAQKKADEASAVKDAEETLLRRAVLGMLDTLVRTQLAQTRALQSMATTATRSFCMNRCGNEAMCLFACGL